MQILIKRRVDGPSVPELGTPTSATFDSITVPLNRASTGPNAISAYTIERATSAAGPWTVAATGLGIFGNPPTQYVDGGRTAVTTYYYRAKAVDSVGRDSGYCATVSVTTAAIPNARKNWNPGNYVWPEHIMFTGKTEDLFGAIDAVNNAANSSRIKGFQFLAPWARVETQKNVYSFDWLDVFIARATQNYTNGKKIIFGLVFDVYSGGLPAVPQVNIAGATFPDYAISEGHVAVATFDGITVKMDSAAAVDRMIALYQGIFDKYGDSPHVEIIFTHETSRAWDNINLTQQAVQWRRFAVALGAMSAGKKAWAAVCHNGLSYADDDKTLMETMTEAGLAAGTPDIVTWNVKSASPPGVDYATYAQRPLKYRTNAAGFKNKFNADTRLWTPTLMQQQVIRNGCQSNDNVRYYSDEWDRNSHPVWALRIGKGGGSYCEALYNSTTPSPVDFCGSNTLAYLLQANVAPARSAYPVRP